MMEQPRTGHTAVQAESLQQRQRDIPQQKHQECDVLAGKQRGGGRALPG